MKYYVILFAMLSMFVHSAQAGDSATSFGEIIQMLMTDAHDNRGKLAEKVDDCQKNPHLKWQGSSMGEKLAGEGIYFIGHTGVAKQIPVDIQEIKCSPQANTGNSPANTPKENCTYQLVSIVVSPSSKSGPLQFAVEKKMLSAIEDPIPKPHGPPIKRASWGDQVDSPAISQLISRNPTDILRDREIDCTAFKKGGAVDEALKASESSRPSTKQPPTQRESPGPRKSPGGPTQFGGVKHNTGMS
ncbi:MAG: hypothetical protein C5B49_16550 [Bdellovibrio sp.]|nr:MAG: hypothetical protein C5B49_16550 [Bdellovibrio sp.]